MKYSGALLGAAILAGSSMGHIAILPPMPDRALTPNTFETPAGCKRLLCDRGFPSEDEFKKTFPGIFKKLRGTYGPDYMLQVKSVEDVQKGVNFARDNNLRLMVISTGHDFIGRETGRSGLRLDLATLFEPTVFTNDWKCGDTLKPTTNSGKVIDFENVMACKVSKNKKKRSIIAQREYDYHFFEKRDGMDCNTMMRLKKRQMEGMSMGGGMPEGVATHNVIKPDPKKQQYARVSGAMYNEKFYTQAADSGLMTLGAQHGGVSVTGGWMQGGGHNPFSNKFGLQVDNVVEVEMVTADGKFRKVSACNEPDLFWAVRGGGGGTFGVVTAITVKVFPTFPVSVSRFFVNSTSRDGIIDASTWFLRNGASLRDHSGVQGYFYIYPGSFQSVLHMPDEFSKIENVKNVTNVMMTEMEKLAGSKGRIEPKIYQYKTYKEWYNAEMGDEMSEDSGKRFLSYFDGSDGSAPSMEQSMANPLSVIPWYLEVPQYPEKRKREVAALEAIMADPAVMHSQPIPRHYLDSRLLSNEHVNSVPPQTLAKAINDSMPAIAGVHWRGFLYGGGKQFEYANDSAGVTPAWRTATFHFIINAVPGSIRRDYSAQPLAKLFPDAGAYINEASTEDPNWKSVFFGSNYDRLLSIKRQHDPTTLFWCVPCVGVDAWTYDDERICKVSEPTPISPSASSGVAPQTWTNRLTTTGINSLPGELGIPHPFIDLVTDYEINGTLPGHMLKSSYFKIAMGEGGSAGGKFRENDPYHPGEKLARPWGS